MSNDVNNCLTEYEESSGNALIQGAIGLKNRRNGKCAKSDDGGEFDDDDNMVMEMTEDGGDK